MMNAVKQRAELYDDWASLVTETLEAKLEKKKGKQEQIRKQSIKGIYQCLSQSNNICSDPPLVPIELHFPKHAFIF